MSTTVSLDEIEPLSARVDALNEAAWFLRHRRKDEALELCRQAVALSQQAGYQPGLASALVTLGLIRALDFALEESLLVSIEALGLMETLPLIPARAFAFVNIGWINYYRGDYSSALDYALRGLDCASELGQPEPQAYAHDLLGTIHAELGEHGQAGAHYQQALLQVVNFNRPEVGMYFYNNAADGFKKMGRLDEALQLSHSAMKIARENDFLVEEMLFRITGAEILLEQKDVARALEYLQAARRYYDESGLQVPYVFAAIMLNMGRAHLAQNATQEAGRVLLGGLNAAEAGELFRPQLVFQQLLAGMYERAGRPDLALKHLRQANLLQVKISNEDMVRNEILGRAMRQLGLARREWGIVQQQAQELEQRVRQRSAELQEANRALEQALLARNTFLAVMSHELRTPLTSILGLAQMLQLDDFHPLAESQKKNVQEIYASGSLVHSLVNDLLQYSRLQTGTVPVEKSPLEINSLCQAVLRNLQVDAQQKRQEVVFSTSGGRIMVETDAILLNSVLRRLAAEVHAFTGEGGRCGIAVCRQTGQAQVVITVWGQGEPREGLWLELARRQVALLGGTLAVQSGCFVVTLV